MKQIIKEMLSSGLTNRLSSKRVCGVIGWIVILILMILSTIYGFQLPEITDVFLYCCVTLMGVESITRIFNKNENNTEEENLTLPKKKYNKKASTTEM